jgi:hypothetical protein
MLTVSCPKGLGVRREAAPVPEEVVAQPVRGGVVEAGPGDWVSIGPISFVVVSK